MVKASEKWARPRFFGGKGGLSGHKTSPKDAVEASLRGCAGTKPTDGKGERGGK